jgi:hypothetical protein
VVSDGDPVYWTFPQPNNSASSKMNQSSADNLCGELLMTVIAQDNTPLEDWSIYKSNDGTKITLHSDQSETIESRVYTVTFSLLSYPDVSTVSY